MFARLVRRAVDHAREERGWSVTQVAAHSGVGRSTIFRWMSGDWQDYPELPKIRAFCATLDLPLGAALRTLTVDAAAPPQQAAAHPEVEADMAAIRCRLADANVPEADKRHVRAVLRHLARQPSPRIRWRGSAPR
ncbi:helix-turn-helix domain-containing protein [Micromonospora sp. BQ11]|uniref:helix-turn-helix domain-containing protein n=1 Tax=Micromonospora sp. BQ11 TaxID=3452212 RepID=UPI003F8A2750